MQLPDIRTEENTNYKPFSEDSRFALDLLFIDIDNYPDFSKLIASARENCRSPLIFLISSRRKFEDAYLAIQLHADYFLLKPLSATDVNVSIKEIAQRLLAQAVPARPWETNTVIRNYFVKKVLPDLEEHPVSVSEINSLYGTSFCNGLYRMIFVKLDISGSEAAPKPAFTAAIRQTENTFINFFESCCSDIVFDEKKDGVMALINYEVQKNEQIMETLEFFFDSLKKQNAISDAIAVTVCVGTAVDSPCLSEQSANQARFAEWARLVYGTNQILYADAIGKTEASLFDEKYSKLKTEIVKSLESFNAPALQDYINQLFQLPTSFLCRYETMDFIWKTLDAFFDANRHSLSPAKVDELRKLTRSIQHNASSLKEFQELFLSEIIPVINILMDNINSRYSRPIRQALSFIDKNYGQQISLNRIAQEASLSPVYFSTLFKKETGQSFSGYLTSYRIDVSKKLLQESHLSIMEIAATVSYTDSRYFSKVFKKYVGISPTEYRRIYERDR
ncbi:MAG: AraC family transcriptional regulator [Clostridiales bacterium]|nr:AraC family transcriptional regulator [Clostridiales bacterium]